MSDEHDHCSAHASQCPAWPAAELARPSQLPPSLYTEHNAPCQRTFLWPLGVSYPGSAPSQTLMHLLGGRAGETEVPDLN